MPSQGESTADRAFRTCKTMLTYFKTMAMRPSHCLEADQGTVH
jgi:hypothetical protein